MKGLVSIAAMLALAVAGCTDSGAPSTGSATDAATGCAADLDRVLTAWERAGFSGTVAIATDGRFECRAGYGWADRTAKVPNAPDTVFSIGSISKAFTAAAVFALVDVGKLSLRDRAGDLVPKLSGPATDATVRQLLLHTSGLTGSHGGDHELLDHDEAVAAIGRLGRAFEPGTNYAYSNAGYSLLALIVESVSGRGYRDYLASRILTLLGRDRIGGFWDGEPAADGPRAIGYLDGGPTEQMGGFDGPHWALAGNGDLAMTMPELATWTSALFTGRVVSSAAADAIARPGFDHGDATSETPGWVAIDESVYGEPVLAAAGGGGDIGHDAVVAWLPESQRVVAIASNTAAVPAGDLLRVVAPALIGGEPLPTPRAGGAADPEELATAAGRYALPTGGHLTVTAHHGRLVIAASGRDAVAVLFPRPEGVTRADVASHQARVLALLRGGTRQGRQERRAIATGLGGPIERLEPVGTIVGGGELRTYVIARSPSESMLAWYAVDEVGGVAAAVLGAAPPRLPFVPTGAGAFRPDDPTGAGPDVRVTFDAHGMTVVGPSGAVQARRDR